MRLTYKLIRGGRQRIDSPIMHPLPHHVVFSWHVSNTNITVLYYYKLTPEINKMQIKKQP